MNWRRSSWTAQHLLAVAEEGRWPPWVSKSKRQHTCTCTWTVCTVMTVHIQIYIYMYSVYMYCHDSAYTCTCTVTQGNYMFLLFLLPLILLQVSPQLQSCAQWLQTRRPHPGWLHTLLQQYQVMEHQLWTLAWKVTHIHVLYMSCTCTVYACTYTCTFTVCENRQVWYTHTVPNCVGAHWNPLCPHNFTCCNGCHSFAAILWYGQQASTVQFCM